MIELPILDASELPAEDGSLSSAFSTNPRGGRRVWRSLGEFHDDESLKALSSKEFHPDATAAPDAHSRRQFLQLMGASVALAGLTGCRKPYEKILPYSRKPEEIIEGISTQYATGMPFRGSLSGLLVESHEGRPTKIEGNPDHPVSRGASGVFEQASILDLYDPDRSSEVLSDGSVSTWQAFAAELSALPASTRLAILIPENSSPTIAGLRARISARFPDLMWAAYGPFGESSEEAGYRSVFARDVRPLYSFSRAKVIVSLDGDFLAATDRNFVHNTREYAASRSVDNNVPSRLYSFEPTYSTTGGKADHRARVRPSEIASVGAAIAARLGVPGAPSTAPPGGEAVQRLVNAVVEDLRQAGADAVVVAGDAQPASVHALCAAINYSLGAVGNTVELLDISDADSTRDAIVADVFAQVKAGAVDALVMLGVNPAYDLAGDDELIAAIQSVRWSVHSGLHVDETATISKWHIPQSHYLEAWGDGRAFDGTLSVVQPLIAPLYGACKSDVELLGSLANVPGTGYDYVRERWQTLLPGPTELAWRRVLHDGRLASSRYAGVSPTGMSIGAAVQSSGASGGTGDIDVQIRLDTRLLDGSYANNAWLQETPDLATKIVWDNVAVMSRATASRLGITVQLKSGKYYVDQVTVTADGRSITLPAWIAPGIADDTIVLATGFGRTIGSTRDERKKIFFDLDSKTDIYGHGAVADGVGTNVNRLRGSSFSNILTGATASRVAARYHIVSTQDHGALDDPKLQQEIESREPVRMATLAAYRSHEAHFEHHALAGADEPWESYPALWEDAHPTKQDFFKDNPYFENQWGMTIDLNTCTGCNACSVACQAENNIQVVGKDEVGRGREMSWIRLDRYFVTEGHDIDDAKMVVQPLPCQHCENAPCESVCPVAATVHSPDGTNQMIYNRCIGTRYCANNCPYKVRRFNYYNWTKTLPTSVQMVQNPDVTVRFRGVMEKCSFCIHRIRSANQQSNIEDRSLQDGEVVTACQQACPANAITFGNISDPESAVVKQKESDRRYELLAELSAKPRISYLGRINNPNPSLEGQA